MTGTDIHVVVGAAGAAGRQVVLYLHFAGHRVRAVTRDGRGVGTPGVELRAADASNPQAVAAACSACAVTSFPPASPRSHRSDCEQHSTTDR
ncbi:MAG TPA: NmrA family NAD(P)-binding protein [Propionibacteriaceae bacterium]